MSPRPFTLVLAVLLLCLLVPLPGALAQVRDLRTVSTPRQLLEALAPHRTIVLKAGDYVLSSAYGLEPSPWFTWTDSPGGRELSLQDLEDVELRGEAGARIVVGDPRLYVLGLYRCKDFSLSGLTFARNPASQAPGQAGAEVEAEAEAGGLYIVDCQDLLLSDSAFEGRNGYPLEIKGSRGVKVSRTRISGGSFGAVYAAFCRDLLFEASTFRDNIAATLLSLEESRDVHFSSSTFSSNEGLNFLGVYTDKVRAENIDFAACTFVRNDFDWFTGPEFLPTLTDPRFEANSFGADWADNSVSPAQGGQALNAAGLVDFAIPKTGLGLSYPPTWAALGGDDLGIPEAFLGLLGPEGQTMALGFALDKPGLDRRSALAAFKALLPTVARGSYQLDPDPEGGGDVVGWLVAGPGKKADIRLRLRDSGGQWYALLGLALVPEALGADSELRAVLDSFGLR